MTQLNRFKMRNIITRNAMTLLILLMSYSSVICQTTKSDFSHIEIITDSATFEKLITNKFIRDTLGECVYDTMMASPLVLSFYINGKESFIHFNPNRGYFANQRGTAYIIFQSRRPGQGKLLEKEWRNVATDTLLSYDFKAPDFTLTEIIYKHHSNPGKKPNNNLIPMLSSYSVETYKKWGFGDSAEVSMKQFQNTHAKQGGRLFENIISVQLSISQKELIDLGSMLQVAGYKRDNNKFIKPGQPEIIFSLNNIHNTPKVEKLTLELSKDIGIKNFEIGTMVLSVRNKIAEFQFH